MTVAIDPAQSSGRKLGITRGVMEPVLRWLAEIVAAVIQPFRYFCDRRILHHQISRLKRVLKASWREPKLLSLPPRMPLQDRRQ